jgi:hypothetical protein
MKILIKDLRSEEKELLEAWATMVKARDNWVCCICGLGYAPNAHHIIPREVKATALDPDNGITLCRNHHKFSRKLSAHNNPLAFFLWLAKYKPVQFDYVCKKQVELLKGDVEL